MTSLFKLACTANKMLHATNFIEEKSFLNQTKCTEGMFSNEESALDSELETESRSGSQR